MENTVQNNQNFKNKKRKRFRPNKNKPIEYKPNCSNEIFNIKLEDLNFTENTYQALKNGGIVCLGQLAQRTMRDMYKIQKIGKKNCFEIRDRLKEYRLDFRQDETLSKDVNNQKQNNDKFNNNQKQNNQKNKDQKQTQNKTDNNSNQKNKDQNKKKENQHEDIKLKKVNDHMQKPKHVKFEYVAPPYTKITRSQKSGILTLDKKEIIPPMYDDIFFFSEGLAAFSTLIDEQEKYGYINEKNEIVIQPIYDIALSFSEGYASVCIDQMCGYIDKSGNKVTEFEFEKATSFEKGLARVKKDGKWGVIDKTFEVRWL